MIRAPATFKREKSATTLRSSLKAYGTLTEENFFSLVIVPHLQSNMLTA